MDEDLRGLPLWRRDFTQDEWICLRNIQAFETMLATEASDDKRRQLTALLADERRRLGRARPL